jgi:hypothetical protein
MKFPKTPSVALALLAILPLVWLIQPVAARDLTTSLKTSSAAVAQAQSATSVRFTYVSPADLPSQTTLNLYLILFDLNTNAVAKGMRVQSVRGPHARALFIFIMRPNQVVMAVIRSPNAPFSSLDPSAVGNLTMQINGGTSTPVTLEEYDANSVAGFYNSETIAQKVGGG